MRENVSVITEAQQLELIKGLGVTDTALSEDLEREWAEFNEVFKEEHGLILQSVTPELLQVSRARLYQLMTQYKDTRYFVRWGFFKHQWFSRKELEAFSQIDRSSGRGRPSLVKIVKQTKDDLL